MVPTFSIIFIAITGLIAFGLPIVTFVYFNKKIKLSVIPLLFGIAGFVLFALGLEGILHSFVLKPQANGFIPLLVSNPYMYVLYGIFAAGIFEETARFISFNILKKKHSGIRTGISYGIGHGGIECIMLVGISMVSNIVFSILINTGNLEMVGNLFPQALVVDPLVNTPSYMFLISGVERIFAFTFHVAASVIVWTAVNYKGMGWLYPVAICMHAAFNIPAAMLQAGLLNSIFFAEVCFAVGAALSVLIAVFITKKMKGRNEINEPLAVQDTPTRVTVDEHISEPVQPELDATDEIAQCVPTDKPEEKADEAPEISVDAPVEETTEIPVVAPVQEAPVVIEPATTTEIDEPATAPEAPTMVTVDEHVLEPVQAELDTADEVTQSVPEEEADEAPEIPVVAPVQETPVVIDPVATPKISEPVQAPEVPTMPPMIEKPILSENTSALPVTDDMQNTSNTPPSLKDISDEFFKQPSAKKIHKDDDIEIYIYE